MEMRGEDEDLRRVEARLAAMEARRAQRRQARAPGGGDGGSVGLQRALEPPGGLETSAMEKRAVTTGADLLEAADGSDSDSDGGSCGFRGRGGSSRLTDSLELSMSMSMAEPAAASNSGRHAAPRGIARSDSRGDSLVVKPPVAVELNDAGMPSKLVMRRRQLEQQAKVRAESDNLDKLSKVKAQPISTPHNANPPADPLTSSLHHQLTTQTPVASVYQRQQQLEPSEGVPPRNPSTVEETKKLAEPKFGSRNRSIAPSSKLVKPEARIAPSGGSGAKFILQETSRSDACAMPNNGTGENNESNTSNIRSKADRPQYSKSNTVIAQFIDNQRLDDFDDPSIFVEEDDLLSQEELALRKSLAKLDRRLTDLSSCAQEQRHSQAPASGGLTSGLPVRSLEPNASTKSPRVEQERDNNKDDGLRNASYGGGAHCRPGQMTSAVSRSSSAKRAEISSGLPKSRVRGGGMVTADGATRATESDGLHKVTIKKNLAHLLFQ